MTTASQNSPPTKGSGPGGGTAQAWAAGGTAFAGALMTVSGVFTIIEGISAIAKDDVYAHLGSYTFKFDLTAWGWIHLVLGVLLLIVGIGVLRGAEWGRVAGIVLACLSIVFHFMWLPYQPLWSLIAIAVAVFVVWALCTDRTGLLARS
jgi:hypothetical protein